MAPCWGVLWCSNGANTTGASLMQHGHRPPHDNPSDPGAIGCECVDASLSPVAFHTQLHNALRHRRCLSKDPLTRDKAQRVAAKWKRAADYGLLAYGILEHSQRGPPAPSTLPAREHDEVGAARLSHGHVKNMNTTWLEFGVAAASSTNITCDALQLRFGGCRARRLHVEPEVEVSVGRYVSLKHGCLYSYPCSKSAILRVWWLLAQRSLARRSQAVLRPALVCGDAALPAGECLA